MSVENFTAFDAEPQHDSTPITELKLVPAQETKQKDSQTWHEIWYEDAEARAFREANIADYHAERLGQPRPERTKAEEIGRHTLMSTIVYESREL